MPTQQKPYKGMAMEGVLATWYAKNTSRDPRRFEPPPRLPSNGCRREPRCSR